MENTELPWIKDRDKMRTDGKVPALPAGDVKVLKGRRLSRVKRGQSGGALSALSEISGEVIRSS
jgi:hypothetical protein